MFSYCKDLTGGNGTKYDASLVNASPADYAKIDVKDQPGLFTCVHERGLQKIEGTDISDGKDGVITHYTCPVCNLLYKIQQEKQILSMNLHLSNMIHLNFPTVGICKMAMPYVLLL